MKYNTGLKDELLEEIIAYAKKYQVEKLVLFGSRSRGDYRPQSDIDLAFIGGDSARFPIDLDEKTNTLLFYDVVNLMDEISDELMDSINMDGILLYEKS